MRIYALTRLVQRWVYDFGGRWSASWRTLKPAANEMRARSSEAQETGGNLACDFLGSLENLVEPDGEVSHVAR